MYYDISDYREIEKMNMQTQYLTLITSLNPLYTQFTAWLDETFNTQEIEEFKTTRPGEAYVYYAHPIGEWITDNYPQYPDILEAFKPFRVCPKVMITVNILLIFHNLIRS